MPWESTTLAGVAVSLSEPPPSHVIRGVTFLLTGAMIPEKEYESTRRVLCMERGLVVIGLYINVLTTAHAWYAEKIPLIYQAYQQQQRRTTRVTTNPTNHDHRHHHSLHNNPSSSTISYKEGFHVVGHSVGGKISLLLAAMGESSSSKSSNDSYEDDDVVRGHASPVRKVLALDPVDMNPSVFTGKSKQIPSLTSQSKVYITWADASSAWTIPPTHNAERIHQALKDNHHQGNNNHGRQPKVNNPQLQPLIVHSGAGHMAYTDFGGGWLGQCLMGRRGKKESNRAALEQVHTLIRKEF